MTLFGTIAFFVHAPHLIFRRVDTNLDFDAHYRWAQEVFQAMSAGNLYPRWMAFANFGVGDPAFLYYSPLYFWLTAGARSLTPDTFMAMQVVEVLASVLLGYFVARCAGLYAPRRIALLAGVAGILLPTAVMVHHGFNGFPWGVAMAGYAALGWAVLRPGAADRLVNVPAIVVLGLLTLTHTVSTLMALMCVSFFLVGRTIVMWNQGTALWKPWASWALTVVLGLGLGAIYLWPAMASLPLISAGIWTELYQPFSSFAFPVFTLGNNMRWFGFQWPIALVILASVALPAWFARKLPSDQNARAATTAMLAIALAALFFASELSYPLWTLDTPLRRVQFPFRFLTLAAPMGLFLTAWVLARSETPATGMPWRRLVIAAPLALSLILGTALTLKAAFVDGTPLPTSEDNLEPYRGLPEYRTTTKDWQAYAEHGGGFAGECDRLGISCTDIERHSTGWRMEIDTAAEVAVRLPFLDFPTWAVQVNGETAAYVPDPDTTLLTLTLPSGNHAIDVIWQRLPQERQGAWISLVTLVLVIVLGLASRMRQRRQTGSMSPAA